MIDTIVKILDVSKNSYWNWKNQNRPIITLLEKYFSKDDLKEFLDTGKISKLEEISSSKKDFDILKTFIVENSLFEAKRKLQAIFKMPFYDVIEILNKKGAKDILKEVLPNITDYTIETAKYKLLEQIKKYEANWVSFKNPQKAKLLSKYIEQSFSKSEVFAICENKETIFDFEYIF